MSYLGDQLPGRQKKRSGVHGMAWHGMVWHSMVQQSWCAWFGVAWCGMAWCDVATTSDKEGGAKKGNPKGRKDPGHTVSHSPAQVVESTPDIKTSVLP